MLLWARELVEQARQLFSDVEWRMYMAAVVGRQLRRAPFGARRSVALPLNVPTAIVKNTSTGRALLVYVTNSTGINVNVFFASSQDVGNTNVGFTLAANNPALRSRQFVLRPDEQLYGQSTGGPARLVVSQEWY